jgi:hypothetical protein
MPSEAAAQQLIPAEPAQLPQVSESAAILQVIERMAVNPAVDVEKFERLMAMHERMKASAAKLEYDRAMSEAQREMAPIRADASNPQTKSKYASYFALDSAIRPYYTKHGFALSFDTAPGAPAEMVRVVCKVSHVGGHREFPQLDMPADGKGAKGGDVMTRTHASGSAITYGRRYLLQMVFNLAVGGDDDGNAAGPGGYISAVQKDELVALLQETNSDTAKFLTFMKAPSLDEIAACNFNKARNALAQKRGAK